MEPRPLRLAYALEFLLALIAFFECWSQVGGQLPLDLMPWWIKLLFAVLFGSVVVRVTAVAVGNEASPPVRLIRWSLALVTVLVIIGLTTYYYYLHEPVEEDTGDESMTSALTATPSLAALQLRRESL